MYSSRLIADRLLTPWLFATLRATNMDIIETFGSFRIISTLYEEYEERDYKSLKVTIADQYRNCLKVCLNISKCYPHPRNATQKHVSHFTALQNMEFAKAQMIQVPSDQTADPLFFTISWELTHVRPLSSCSPKCWLETPPGRARNNQQINSLPVTKESKLFSMFIENYPADAFNLRGHNTRWILRKRGERN